MSDITEEIIYEYWDCPKCGTKGIRGDIYSCRQCGYQRDNTITFYRMEGIEEKVESLEKQEEFKQGPDWICSYCESLNKSNQISCSTCNAKKEDSETNYFQEQAKRKERETNKTNIDEGRPSAQKFSAWKWVAAIVVFLGGICYYGNRTENVEYEVTKVEWIRLIDHQKYKRVQKIDWKDDLSGDDIQISEEKKEIRRYEKRQVGTRTESYTDTEEYQNGTKRECSTSYESTGSGASKKITSCNDVPVYSTRQVTKYRDVPIYQDFPIYDIKVRYSSKVYTSIGYDKKQGTDNNPIWPEIMGMGEDNKEDRGGEKLESLVASIKKNNKEKEGPEEQKVKMPEKPFREIYKLGSTINMSVKNFGGFSYKNEESDFDEEDYKNKILSKME